MCRSQLILAHAILPPTIPAAHSPTTICTSASRRSCAHAQSAQITSVSLTSRRTAQDGRSKPLVPRLGGQAGFRQLERFSKTVPFGANPWLAYVLVRQLCFVVADEDVRHAQLMNVPSGHTSPGAEPQDPTEPGSKPLVPRVGLRGRSRDVSQPIIVLRPETVAHIVGKLAASGRCQSAEGRVLRGHRCGMIPARLSLGTPRRSSKSKCVVRSTRFLIHRLACDGYGCTCQRLRSRKTDSS